MGRLSVWFGDEGEFLEVSLDQKTGSFNDLGNGVFERVNEDGETIEFAILNVNNRAERELPFEAEFRRISS